MEDLGTRDPPLNARSHLLLPVLLLVAALVAGQVGSTRQPGPRTCSAHDAVEGGPARHPADARQRPGIRRASTTWPRRFSSPSARKRSAPSRSSYKGKTIVLTPDQALASVAGRLVSLPAPRRTRRQALAGAGRVHQPRARARSTTPGSISGSRRDLLIVGDLRVPRVTIRYEPLGARRAADDRRHAARRAARWRRTTTG